MLTDWIIPILAVTASGVVFALIYSKIGLFEKVNIRIKSRPLRIMLFILAAVLFGIVSAIVRRVMLNISEIELLAEITQWAMFGAILPFVIGGISSKNAAQETN